MVAAWDRDPSTTDERLDEAVRRLVEALHPERIYLFGSRARGDATADSDYDLMVVVDHAGKRFVPNAAPPVSNDADDARQLRELSRQAYEALYGLRIPIDVLVWTRDYFDWQLPAAASLAATVLREGRLLYAA